MFLKGLQLAVLEELVTVVLERIVTCCTAVATSFVGTQVELRSLSHNPAAGSVESFADPGAGGGDHRRSIRSSGIYPTTRWITNSSLPPEIRVVRDRNYGRKGLKVN